MLECGFQVHKVSEYNSPLQGVMAWAEALAHDHPYHITVKLSLKFDPCQHAHAQFVG